MNQPHTTTQLNNYWAIVPAAGVGKRMGGNTPKQYLQVAGKMVIEHTLQRLLDHPKITGLVIALGDHDEYWADVKLEHHGKPLLRVQGGAERCHSVLNALLALDQLRAGDNKFNVSENDWVLVHDAARPCIRATDVDKLIEQVEQNGQGGLLALPVRDTMKRQIADQPLVAETVDRTGLWHALTPQMFRLAALNNALSDAVLSGAVITDESSAMERAGINPVLIEGHEDNLKITRQPDLKLAEMYLKNQEIE